MAKDANPPRPAPPIVVNVLGVSYSDGFLVIRTDAAQHGVRIHCHIQRVPWAPGVAQEGTAEDVAEMLLPRRFAHLWERADCVVAVTSTLPLTPSTLLEARNAELSIADLNRVGGEG